MYFWLFLQIYLCDLRLLLCSWVTYGVCFLLILNDFMALLSGTFIRLYLAIYWTLNFF